MQGSHGCVTHVGVQEGFNVSHAAMTQALVQAIIGNAFTLAAPGKHSLEVHNSINVVCLTTHSLASPEFWLYFYGSYVFLPFWVSPCRPEVRAEPSGSHRTKAMLLPRAVKHALARPFRLLAPAFNKLAQFLAQSPAVYVQMQPK